MTGRHAPESRFQHDWDRAVGQRCLAQLSAADARTLITLAASDDPGLAKWVTDHLPDYVDIVREEFEATRRHHADDRPDSHILSTLSNSDTEHTSQE